MNPSINQVVVWMVSSFGNQDLAVMLNLSVVFPLKHLSRNRIRLQLGLDGAVLCNRDKLATTDLPAVLLDYVVFKQ